MKERFYISMLGVGLILVVAITGILQAQVTEGMNTEAATSEVVPDSTIVIAMAQEPDSLYLYGTSMLAAKHVMQAFMDGPIDTNSFDYQPVVLDKIPALNDGDAIVNTVTVTTNDVVRDAYDSVVTLTPGVMIIDADGNLVTFDGTPVLMTQMAVTFTLKTDVFWSDGTLLTTADSVFSKQIDCHPDTPTSKYTCDRTASYMAPDAQTAVWTGLPGYLDSTYFTNFWTPLPEHVLGGMPPAEILTSTYATHPLGWGPFQIDVWLPGDSIRLSRNPYYWQPDLPHVDKLIFKFYPDASQAFHDLLAGSVHLVTIDATDAGLLPDYISWDATGALILHSAIGTVWEHIDFGILPADDRYVFFDDVEVRQALTLCTDRQTMMDAIYGGESEVLHAYIPSSHPLYAAANITEWPFDPAQGRAKLEAVGWHVDTDGWRYKDGQKFAITYKTTNNSIMRQQMAQIFQENMANCGIDVMLEYIPSNEFFQDWPDGPIWGRKYDLVEFAWLTSVDPPCSLYTTWGIPDNANPYGSNNTGYSNSVFDNACNMGQGSLPGTDAYIDGHTQALEIWSQELPVIPLFPRVKTALSNPNLLGVHPDPTENSELWNVETWSFTAAGAVTPGEGGAVTSHDSRITVQVPAGAFTDTVTLSHTPWQAQPTGVLFNGGQFFALTAVYDTTGTDASLITGTTYTLTITYSPRQLLALGTGESGLGLYYWDGGQWVLETTSVIDADHKTVTATPNRLGLWTLLSTLEPTRTFLPVVEH